MSQPIGDYDAATQSEIRRIMFEQRQVHCLFVPLSYLHATGLYHHSTLCFFIALFILENVTVIGGFNSLFRVLEAQRLIHYNKKFF